MRIRLRPWGAQSIEHECGGQGLDAPRFGDLPLPVQQNRKAQLHACEKTADAIIGLTDGHDETARSAAPLRSIRRCSAGSSSPARFAPGRKKCTSTTFAFVLQVMWSSGEIVEPEGRRVDARSGRHRNQRECQRCLRAHLIVLGQRNARDRTGQRERGGERQYDRSEGSAAAHETAWSTWESQVAPNIPTKSTHPAFLSVKMRSPCKSMICFAFEMAKAMASSLL